tara:strand:- start:2060 stop:2296 length:237 start_codon:yes stop_codon:yes gene_type:complete
MSTDEHETTLGKYKHHLKLGCKKQFYQAILYTLKQTASKKRLKNTMGNSVTEFVNFIEDTTGVVIDAEYRESNPGLWT